MSALARYCATMAGAAATHLDGPILELGPRLGVVTSARLEKGVDPSRITSIEYDADFAETLRERFPGVRVIRGDGFDLDATLGDGGQALFQRYLDRLVPGGNITQLSYLVTPPVKPVEGVFAVSSTPIVWDNIPPARVWIYSPVGAQDR